MYVEHTIHHTLHRASAAQLVDHGSVPPSVSSCHIYSGSCRLCGTGLLDKEI